MPDGMTRPKILGDAFFIGSTAAVQAGTDCPVQWDASALNWIFRAGTTVTFGVPTGSSSGVTISNGDGTTDNVPAYQFLGTTKARASLLIGSFNTTNDGTVAPSLNLLKSGHGTVGSNTIVASGEVLGEINFFGADGVDFESPAARIQVLADTTVGAGDMPGRIVFSTTADSGETLTEALRITSSQDVRVNDAAGLIVGSTSAQVTISDGDGSTDLIPEVQVLGTAKADSSVLIANFSATAGSAAAPSLNFLKSSHATLGSNTAAANGAILGQINFFAADGTDFESPGARIHAAAAALATTGDTPANLVFSTTPDGSETLAARLTISSEGLFTIAASSTPASTSGATGTNAGAIETVTGGLGGESSHASGTGGVGGGWVLLAGNGGACTGTTAPSGGAGGALSWTTGAGAACSTAASGNSTGGNGGAVAFTSGAGGAVSGAVAGTATGGTSGTVTIASGTGGAVTATTGTNAGGPGGTVAITGGNGGAASGATDTGGVGASVNITAGTGGNGDTGGAGGTVLVTAGSGGTGGNVAGGYVDLRGGAATGSGVIGNVRIEGGTSLGAASTRQRLLLGATAGLGIYWANATPHTVVTAAQGSLCLVTNGSSTSTRAFINTDGATAWTAITTAS